MQCLDGSLISALMRVYFIQTARLHTHRVMFIIAQRVHAEYVEWMLWMCAVLN